MIASPDLADRYGVARPGRRRLLLSVVGIVVAVFLGWLAWVVWVQATPPVDSEFEGFSVVDDRTTEAYVGVALQDGVTARCVVRALAEDHSVVGEVTFAPTEGRNEVLIRTERRATSADLVGCTADGQPRPR